MGFFNKDISDYIDIHSSDESKILADLRRETEIKCLNPIMLSGKAQGNLLRIIKGHASQRESTDSCVFAMDSLRISLKIS